MYFGKNLKFLMKKNKITGTELGKLIGKSKSVISKQVKGEFSPSVQDLIIYRNVLKVDLDTFFFVDLQDKSTHENFMLLKKIKFMTEKLEKDSSDVLWLGMLEKGISDLLPPPSV